MQETPPIKRAVKDAGGPKAVGKALGISHQAVVQWDQCPPLRVLDMERLSGMSRHELRPDMYPAPELERAAS